MIVNTDILWNDAATRNSKVVQRCKFKDTAELTIEEVADMITFVSPYKINDNMANNPYAQELCKRAGNLKAFMEASDPKQRRKIFDNAAASFGYTFH